MIDLKRTTPGKTGNCTNARDKCKSKTCMKAMSHFRKYTSSLHARFAQKKVKAISSCCVTDCGDLLPSLGGHGNDLTTLNVVIIKMPNRLTLEAKFDEKQKPSFADFSDSVFVYLN